MTASDRGTGYSTSPSRWDIFPGYSYIAPFGTVDAPHFGSVTTPVNFVPVNPGAIGSISHFFNKDEVSRYTGQPLIFFDGSPLPADVERGRFRQNKKNAIPESSYGTFNLEV
jgi:hypothetical protein